MSTSHSERNSMGLSLFVYTSNVVMTTWIACVVVRKVHMFRALGQVVSAMGEHHCDGPECLIGESQQVIAEHRQKVGRDLIWGTTAFVGLLLSSLWTASDLLASY